MPRKGNMQTGTSGSQHSSVRRSMRSRKGTAVLSSSGMVAYRPLTNSKRSPISIEDTEESLKVQNSNLPTEIIIFENSDTEHPEFEENVAKKKNEIAEKDPNKYGGKEKCELIMISDKAFKEMKSSQTENSSSEKNETVQHNTLVMRTKQQDENNINEIVEAVNNSSSNPESPKSDLPEQSEFSLYSEKVVISGLIKKLPEEVCYTGVCAEKVSNKNENYIYSNIGPIKTSIMNSSIIVNTEQLKEINLNKEPSGNNIQLLSIKVIPPVTNVDKNRPNINLELNTNEHCNFVPVGNSVGRNEPTEFKRNAINDKIDELLLNVDDISSIESETEGNDLIDTMAEEGEEDTPSEGSNDIIEVGEEINTTESELSSDDSYENDSFIDDESYQLLSGEEYDLSLEDSKKRKRIILLSSGSDDTIVHIKKTEERICNKRKKSRILRYEDSSDENPMDCVTQTDLEENLNVNMSNECEEDQNTIQKPEDCKTCSCDNTAVKDDSGSSEISMQLAEDPSDERPMDSVIQTDLEEKFNVNMSNECEKDQNTINVQKLEDFKTCPCDNTAVKNDFENSEVTTQLASDQNDNDAATLNQKGDEDQNIEIPCQILAPTLMSDFACNKKNMNKKVKILENIQVQNLFSKDIGGHINDVITSISTEAKYTSNMDVDLSLNYSTSSLNCTESVSNGIHNELQQDFCAHALQHQPFGITTDYEYKVKKKKILEKNGIANNVCSRDSTVPILPAGVKKYKKKRNKQDAQKIANQLLMDKETITSFSNVRCDTTEEKYFIFEASKQKLRDPKPGNQKNNNKKRKYCNAHYLINGLKVNRKKKIKCTDQTREKSDEMNILDDAILYRKKDKCLYKSMSDEDWKKRNILTKVTQITATDNVNNIRTQMKRTNINKLHAKNFRDSMLYDNGRVKRMETRQLLRNKIH